MGSGRFAIGVILRGDSNFAAFLDEVQELVGTANILLAKVDDINIAFVILTNRENVFVVEQIVELNLSKDELKKLRFSAEVLKKNIAGISLS